jgi:phage head maturation protease
MTGQTAERRQTGVMLQRDYLDVQVREIDEETRTVWLSFSSESPVMRWWGPEILQHDAESVRMERINAVGVGLFNHDRNIILGRVVEAKIDPQTRRGLCGIRFDEDEESEKYYRKAKSGSLRGVSVGYQVYVWEEVAAGAVSSNGRFNGPCDVATEWEPMEVSLCSVPADWSVGVGRAVDTPAGEPDNTKGEAKMGDDTQTRAAGQEPAAPVIGTPPAAATGDDNARAEAVAAERTRVSEITALCRDFGVDPQEHIAKGDTVDAVRAAILEARRKDWAPPAASRAAVGEEKADTFRQAGADALLLRAGLAIEQAKRGGGYVPHAAARELANMSLREMLVEDARLRGVATPHVLTTEQLIRGAMTPDSQFAAMLDNSVGKAMLIGLSAAATTFQLWTSRGSNRDFKATKRYRMSEAGALELVPQSGEIKRDEMQDEGVTTILGTYGKRWALTRQAVINDDLDFIGRMPVAYVQAAMRGLNHACYAPLTDNATIYDGKALFHTDHGNYVASGSGDAPSTATLSAARTAMRRQTGLRALQAVNITPWAILAPPELETDIDKLLNSIADVSAAQAGVTNPFRGKLTSIIDPEMTDTDAWFVAGNPAQADTVEVSYLNGRDTPIIENAMADFDVLGWNWRIYWDWAVTVLDFRALYMNAGK